MNFGQRCKLNMDAIKDFISSIHLFQIKSCHCHHEKGCFYNMLSGAFRSFYIAYGVKTTFGIISMLISMRKKKLSIIKFLNVFIEADTLRFAIFPTLYAGIQKSILCYFRNNNQDDKRKYSFISGFVAGYLSLICLQTDKRAIWALYLATRSMDTIFTSYQNKGLFKKRQFYYVLLMAISTLVTGYAYGSESETLEAYMKKFYLRFANETVVEVSMRGIWHEQKKLKLGY